MMQKEKEVSEVLEEEEVCEMKILDPTGHTKISWNPRNKQDVKAAEETFTTMRAKGFQAFRVNYRGAKGERLTEFDPQAKSIILIPQLQGG